SKAEARPTLGFAGRACSHSTVWAGSPPSYRGRVVALCARGLALSGGATLDWGSDRGLADLIASHSRTERRPVPAALLYRIENDEIRRPLGAASLTLGTAASSDIVIDAPSVASVHARVEPAREGWRVVDLGSD